MTAFEDFILKIAQQSANENQTAEEDLGEIPDDFLGMTDYSK